MSFKKDSYRQGWYLLGGLVLLVCIGLTTGGVFAGRLTDTTAGLARSAPARPAHPANPGGTDLVISQVYGGGGNSGATYRNDFVEIFNPTNAPISFAGWSVQYASATGVFTTANNQLTVITGTIPAGGYFLVQEAAGANITTTILLPTPDAIGLSNLSATNGKVALANVSTPLGCGSNHTTGTCVGNPNLVDYIGYGTATDYEGTVAGALTNTTAAIRNSGGCTDTDVNSADFTVSGPPNPRNSASTPNPCGGGTPLVTNTPTSTPTGPTNTPTNTIPPTVTSTFTNTPTPTATHPPSTAVVISEFRTRGSAGGNDEFIELYNLSNTDVNIGGWKVNGSSGCGPTVITRFTVPANLMLPSHSHYLAVNSLAYSGTVPGDITYTTGIADNGGMALLDASNLIIDAVGMCITTTYYEGTPLTPMSASTDQSYERLPGGAAGNGQDTNDNSVDFFFNATSSNPQNLSSPPEPPFPTATSTATATALATSTATATPTCPPVTQPVSIVEFSFNPDPITIYQGATVQWTNNGGRAHTTTSDSAVWNSGTLNPGQSFSFTFGTPGTFPYHCAIHTFMTGTINVLAGCPPPATDTPTPTNTPAFTDTPTFTNTPIPTNTSTNTAIPTNTSTDTPIPTFTSTNTSIPTFTSTNTAIPTSTSTNTPVPTSTSTNTSIPTSTSTDTPVPPTNTATPAGIINGHLTWQGVAAANRPLVTGTLTLCVSGSQQNFSFTTDTSGNFTITTGLPDGTYHWQTKGGRHITSASPTDGTDLTISGGHATQEFGTQKGGNTNADNIVNATDFSNLKAQFGQSGVKSADFDYNQVVNASDFGILKGNFGQAGHAITCP